MAALFIIVAGLFYLLIDPAHSLNNGKLKSCQFDKFFFFYFFCMQVLGSLHPWAGTPGALNKSKQARPLIFYCTVFDSIP